ncbi:MAG: ISLre2 family transposase, partial [Limnochordia bacterium]
MINILQQIVEKFISEVTGFLSQDKVLTLEEIQTTLTSISQNFVLDMTKAYLELLDQAIVEDKKGRTKKGFVIERRDDK